MDKINKLSLPATIIIASVIMGGFYYATQISKQKSIERQQTTEEQQKQQKNDLLKSCLAKAEQDITAAHTRILKVMEIEQEKSGCGAGCQQAINEAYEDADTKLQLDKDNCFKQYK